MRVQVVEASSDHLAVTSDTLLQVGGEVRFEPDHAALLRAITSSCVAQRLLTDATANPSKTSPIQGDLTCVAFGQ